MFGAGKLNKNADISKHKYSGYGFEFDDHGTFFISSGGFGQNVIIFGVDMYSSVNVDNKKKDILILDEGLTQGLDGTRSTAKKSIELILLWLERNFV